MNVSPGDVIRYRPGRVLEPQTGTVMAVRGAAVILCCETWIRHADILRVLRHVDEMPTPDSISIAMRHGDVFASRQPRRPGGQYA